jgi:hypothetical protein
VQVARLALLALSWCACESSTAKAPIDLAVPDDLSLSGDLTKLFDCSEYHSCLAACATAPAPHTCAVGCESIASAVAKSGYQKVLDCVAAACAVDAGQSCSSSEAALVDDPTADLSTISDACGNCIDAQAASGGSCYAIAQSCFSS